MKKAWKYSVIAKLCVILFAFILGCTITLSFTRIEKGCENCLQQSHLAARPAAKVRSAFLLILILSAPDNVVERQTIRETWLSLTPQRSFSADPSLGFLEYNERGFLQQESVQNQRKFLDKYQKVLTKADTLENKVPDLKVVHYFSVGSHGLKDEEKRRLLEEKRLYEDMLIMDELEDSYANLTRKLLMSFEIMDTKVSFKYLLKTDDDTYVKLGQLVADLHRYDEALAIKRYSAANPRPELYWGYFNGRAQVKKKGQWKEEEFTMCERYLPYALGGGYVVSSSLAKFVAANANVLNSFVSEDISMGSWLSTWRNIYRRHDVRFDTAYLPRQCKNYHIVLHKRTIKDMLDVHRGELCSFENANDTKIRRPVEYFYDWSASQMRCCDSVVL